MITVDKDIEVLQIENGNQYHFQCMSGNESKLPTEGIAPGSSCDVYTNSNLSKILNFIKGKWINM